MLHDKMSPSPTSPPTNPSADAHENDVEAREAYEYWGYLFRADKTGTPKLKSLLRGLKEVMNNNYENNNNRTHETAPASAPHEQPDLTPTQLAHFYRDLHGNYDQLFLATPNESIAFIYKSLGCLHSLQPLRHATKMGEMANGDRATAFTDPVVPALKTEGWIMWQTIQILLGPEEHAEFLREAVEKWDVRDVETGNVFPKILPRECFPREPDKHMVAWYEGVSERLRKEAEAEEAAKFHDSEGEDEARPRRLRGRRDVEDEAETDEESVDSRAPALAYFRNPLYRHSDGRPSIVRHSSKRPGLSPRQTMMDKGKEAVGTFGRIARNVGSPYLWDGRGGGSRSGSAHGVAPGGRRRPSHSHTHHSPNHEDGPPTSSGSDRRESHRRRTGSSQRDIPQNHRPTSAVSSSAAADDEWWETSDVGSPPPANQHHHLSPSAAAVAGGGGLAAAAAARHGHGHSRSRSQHIPPSRDAPGKEGHHRRHRSAEPTPSGPAAGGEPEDYFAGANEARRGSAPVEETRRHSGESGNSAGGEAGGVATRPLMTPPPVPAGNGVGVSFGPSAGPLFASTVARSGSVASRGGGRGGGRGRDEGGRGGPARDEGRRGSAVEGMGRHQQYPPHSHPHPHQQDPSQRHSSQQRHSHYHPQDPSSRRDEGRRREGHHHHHDDPRRFDSPRRSRGGRGGGGYDESQNQRLDDGRRGMSRDSGGAGRRYPAAEPDPYEEDEDDYPPPRRSGEDFGRRSEDFARGSREDVGGPGGPRRSREDVGAGGGAERRSGGRKQTRFAGDDGGAGGPPAERGVSGRRYPDGSPWGGRE